MEKTSLNLVVFDGDPSHDWVEIFKGIVLPQNKSIRVVQTSWIDTRITVYGDSGALLSCVPVRESSGEASKPRSMTLKPDFVLIRNQPRGAVPSQDCREVLFGLMSANIPSVNSLESEYFHLERPLMYGALKHVEQKLGHDKFPLIPQTYYSDSREMIVGPGFPCVIKVGHAHAGQGKMIARKSETFDDLRTVLSLSKFYVSAEPFIDSEYEFRIQKIGDNYRMIKKDFTGVRWNTHFGGAFFQDAGVEAEVEDKYKVWADECAKCFGGMDLLGIDALRGKDGKDYIIELNSSSIGLLPDKWMEDTLHVRDIVVAKLVKIYCTPEEEKTFQDDGKATVEAKEKVIYVEREVDAKNDSAPQPQENNSCLIS
jgi:hypothetical protein